MKKKLLIIGGNSSVSKSFQKLFNKVLNLFNNNNKKNSKKNCFFLDLNNDVSILEFVKHIKK